MTIPASTIGLPEPLPEGAARLVGPYLARQRWYAGEGTPGEVAVVDSRRLEIGGEGRSIWWVVVDTGGSRYQVLLGSRAEGEPADFLNGNDAATLGAGDGCFYYDAVLDPDLAVHLLEVVSGGAEGARLVRPITAEQSNTSLVFDDRVILKVFRKLMDGPNPDVEVTSALASAGFPHVAAPVASWREGGVDYMFAQQFLAGGSEGWALALTSLRDFYSSAADDPAEVGGDFAAEASRLGRMTALMHLTLAAVYGVEETALAEGRWEALTDDIERRLGALEASGEASLDGHLVGRLRSLTDPGPAIRVHGDYHLGQVMRTDSGWYVLDFEGEPARGLDQRLAEASPLKDVTGMLRSLHYASRFVLRERAETELEVLSEKAEAWESHNRRAFLDGYHAVEGIGALLPAGEAEAEVAAAYEIDKALYELDYERAYRPDWVDIPMGAVARILGASGPGRSAP